MTGVQPDQIRAELLQAARIASGATLVVQSAYDPESDDVTVMGIDGLGSELAQNGLRLIRRNLPDFEPTSIRSKGVGNRFSRSVYIEGKPAEARLDELARGVLHPYVLNLAGTLFSVRMVAMFPMLVEGVVVGALSFLSGDALNDGQRAISAGFARQAALTAECDRLKASLARQKGELEASKKLIVSAEERVRRDVAGLLHGAVQSQLLVAWYRLGLCEELMDRDPQGAHELLVQVREQIDHIREHEIREASHRLHPGILDVGLLPALRSLADRFGDVFQVEVSAGERITGLDNPGDNRIEPDLRFAAYRVIEEALTNSAKHASAKQVSVSLEVVKDELEIRIRDDGGGIDTKSIRSGLGLRAMAQHVGAMGGTVHVGTGDGGGGVEVLARFPFAPVRRAQRERTRSPRG